MRFSLTLPRAVRTLAGENRMPRPKIEGLTALNLRLQQETLDALDEWVREIRAERHDPGYTRTDLIRELLHRATAERAEARSARTRKAGSRAAKGGAA